eukprot:scaffold382_cov380-Prasinococcus_capsulatus_cf.AAC.3
MQEDHIIQGKRDCGCQRALEEVEGHSLVKGENPLFPNEVCAHREHTFRRIPAPVRKQYPQCPAQHSRSAKQPSHRLCMRRRITSNG